MRNLPTRKTPVAQSLFNKVAGILLVALNVNFPAKCVSTGFIRFICGCNIHHIIFTGDISIFLEVANFLKLHY